MVITKDGHPCSLINGNRHHTKTRVYPYMKNIGKFRLKKILGRKPWREFDVDTPQVS